MTSGIIEILSEYVPLQNLVGKTADGSKYKIFPVVAEQGEEVDYVTVFKGQNNPLSSLTKDLASELDYPLITVTYWSKNFRTTERGGELIRKALDNVTSITDNGYAFNRIWLVDDRDGFDAESRLFCHVSLFRAELIIS